MGINRRSSECDRGFVGGTRRWNRPRFTEGRRLVPCQASLVMFVASQERLLARRQDEGAPWRRASRTRTQLRGVPGRPKRGKRCLTKHQVEAKVNPDPPMPISEHRRNRIGGTCCSFGGLVESRPGGGTLPVGQPRTMDTTTVPHKPVCRDSLLGEGLKPCIVTHL